MIKYDLTIIEIIQTVIALGALVTAAATIIYTKVYTKKSKTADLLLSLDNNKELLAAMQVIRGIHYSDRKADIYAEKQEVESIEAESLRYVLNHLERIAACVEHKIYDYSLIKATQKNRIIKTVEVAMPYISKIRETTSSAEAYVAIERLAKKLKT
ncbi:DUF4760 domain-containing protein [Halomonas sp. SIMBA_159]